MAIGRRGDLRAGGLHLPVKTLDEAIAMMHAASEREATSIFTSSGKRRASSQNRPDRVDVGVNIGSPRRWPTSRSAAPGQLFGDLKAHGRDGIEFYTDKKVTISRWFEISIATSDFGMTFNWPFVNLNLRSEICTLIRP